MKDMWNGGGCNEENRVKCCLTSHNALSEYQLFMQARDWNLGRNFCIEILIIKHIGNFISQCKILQVPFHWS